MKHNNIIAIDWSHTKNLTTFDGTKIRLETSIELCKRLAKIGGESKDAAQSSTGIQPLIKNGIGGESTSEIQSTPAPQPPSVVLEQGCPMSLIYRLTSHKIVVYLISNRATEDYRKQHSLEKTDENDAKIIYELANNGAFLQSISPDDKFLQMHDIYHQYCRYQKARVAMQNMKKAHLRAYSGDGESKHHLNSKIPVHPSPDLSPYDIAIDVLQAREKTLIKRLEETAKGLPLFEMGGESTFSVHSNLRVQPPTIKGLGQRLWWGIIVTANPANFKCLSAYLRFCGLTGDVIKTHKYNRHARMLYRLLAEETMKLRDPKFRAIYDECKVSIAHNHPDYTKGHIHNAALNRTATFLAKTIYGAVK